MHQARKGLHLVSRRMFPSMSMLISASEVGTIRMHTTTVVKAKINRSSLLTLRSDVIRIRRSRAVVSRRMIGGCISGTRAM